jgi:membrane-bound serine protease (ClpP class)
MKSFLPRICLVLAFATMLPAQAPDAPPAEKDFVVICHLSEMVDEGMAVIVERAVKEAENAAGIIFVVDTFGGRVDSAIRITQAIINAKPPTVAYISNNGAISAGAMISYACDTIIMAPATEIGASAPVTMGGGDQGEMMTEKSMSFVRAKYRSLGELQGHSPALGEAMVDPDLEVRGAVDEKGNWVFWISGESRQKAKAEESDESGEVIPEAPGDLPMPSRDIEREIRRIMHRDLEGSADEKDTESKTETTAPVLEDAPRIGPNGEPPEDAVIVCPAGDLLTMNSNDALRYQFIPIIAASREEVTSYMGWGGFPVREVIPTWAEALFRFLTSPMISGLLLLVGIGGIYFEIQSPGFGLAGTLGVTALAIFFGAQYVIGMADFIDIILVGLGLGLIVLEVFVLPGFGVAGIAGIISLIAGLYMSLTRVPIPQYDWDYARLEDAGITAATFIITFSGLVALSAYFLPRSGLMGRLVLADAQDTERGYIVQEDRDEQLNTGLRGVSSTVLRPAGRGRFNGNNYDVVTRGEYLDPGTPIEIIQVEGNRYVVREVKAGGTEAVEQ